MYFSDVIGHEAIKKRLLSNAGDNRISHAQLFLGHQASGALPLALAYARYIQCRDKGLEDACGKCPSCLKFNKYEHPDIHFIFPTSTNKEHKDRDKISSKLFLAYWRKLLIEKPYFDYFDWLEAIEIENKQANISAEDCNDIIRTLSLKSYESPYKIMIIYMVEKLNYAAAPKLLKIVEEPPGNTLFLMVSENKDRIISTILSRTQVLKVPLPQVAEVAQALINKYGFDHKKATRSAFMADSIITDALRLIRAGDKHMADFDSFREWMRFCFKNDTAKILKWAEKTARDGREKQKSFLQYGLKIFRLCLLNNYNVNDLVRLEDEERSFLEGFSPYINHHNAVDVIAAFNTAIFHLERNANPRIIFADLSFQLSRLMHVKSS